VGLVLAAVAWAGSPIVHRVSVGVPDFCGALPAQDPGCNANFSLEAKQFADGRVTGQYTDQFGHGNGGFHARIDCLYVSGNTAWIAGVITSGWNVGARVVTEVQDNGKSAKDPPDKITYSYAPWAIDCHTHPALPLYAVPKGQVKVS
jgi:hypothetical protein